MSDFEKKNNTCIHRMPVCTLKRDTANNWKAALQQHSLEIQHDAGAGAASCRFKQLSSGKPLQHNDASACKTNNNTQHT